MVSTLQQRDQRMQLFSSLLFKTSTERLLFFPGVGCVVLSPAGLFQSRRGSRRGPGQLQLLTFASRCHKDHPRCPGCSRLLLRAGAEGMRFSITDNHKVSCNELGMYYSGLALKITTLILFCTAKTRQDLSAPGRHLHRENSTSIMTCLQSFREFPSVHKYHNYGYVINTWKSRLDQSDKMLKQYPRLILVQLKFPAAVH